jgi:periplasmic protein CpxP/Spy
MLKLIDPAVRRLAAAAIGAALLAGSAAAATADHSSTPPLLAQATPATPAPAPSAAPAPAPEPSATPAKKRRTPTDRVELRIKQLHEELKITPEQEPQFDAVAQAMRDDAKAMEDAIAQRREAKSMTAVDDLKAYQAIADAHSQGLQKLIPAFSALYDTMSPEQKKNADAVFGHTRHPTHHKKKSEAQ